MSNFDETVIRRLTALEREVERLRVKERPAGGSGVTDHGALTGLSDNDHPQYLLTTGKAADSDKLDGIDSTGFATAGHDHDSDYLGITAKASDSDKLDNIDSTGFVQTSGNQTVAGIKTFSSIPVLPASNPTTANEAVRKGYADATYTPLSYKDGWIPVSGTWTYKTATTITVPSGAASIYKVGMGIRLTQSSTVKYFYIVGVADTVLTITGGSDYTLANATISAVSYTNTPATAIGFPNTFSYTPTVTYAGGSTDPTGWTRLGGLFSIVGNIATVMITGQLNRGSGNRTYISFTPPVTYAAEAAPSCTHSLISSEVAVAPAYFSASKITVALGAAMGYNGYIWVNVTYKI